MAYTRTRRSYGSRGYRMMSVFTPDGATAGMPWILDVRGGGWGYRSTIPLEDPENGASPSWYAGALTNPLSVHEGKYIVISPQIASNSHNGPIPAALASITPWEDGEAVPFNVKRQFGGQTCVSKRAHTASAANQPPSGGAGNSHWEIVSKSEVNQPIIPNRGEQQNAYAGQAVADLRECWAYCMQEAASLGIDPTKGAISGESAGGFDAFRFLTADSAPFVHGDHVSNLHPQKAPRSTMPQAAIIGISPMHLDRYVNTDRGGVQGQMRGFLTSVYGRPELIAFSGWNELSSSTRRGVDPLRNMARTGVSVPTYLDHAFDSRIDTVTNEETGALITDDDVFNGYTHTDANGSTSERGPNPHHARNGWIAFKDMTGPREQNRQARADCIFAQAGAADDTFDEYTLHGDYGGAPATTALPALVDPILDGNGDVTNQAAVTASKIARKRVVGDKQIAWLDLQLGI